MKQKMTKMLRIKKMLLFLSFMPLLSEAQVKYDEGAVVVQGLTCLQSSRNANEYYYLPQFPRLATKPDGTFEFLCLKYVSAQKDNNGGLLHALVEFTLPDTARQLYEKELQKIIPGARIAGPVPILESKSEGDENIRPGFEVISAVLNNKDGKEGMTKSVITSGYAPFMPGSKAAVAALLNPAGASLLWNSFTGPTSDVSVAVNGYYEAMVRGYNAIVTAEMSVIYTHFSKLSSVQKDYTKEQIRKIVDTLQRTGSIKVDVFDRSSGLGIKTSDMEGILSSVTNKLIETMFDAQNGWSKEPDRIDPNLGFDPKGRRGEKTGVMGGISEMVGDIMGSLPVVGFFTRKKTTNPKYITDNQFVLKDIKSVRSSKFYLNLSKSTTIKVPFHTAGNLSGLFGMLGDDERYFRIVNLDPGAFERRGINFQVDGDFVEAFDDIINFVTVNFRKKYGTGHEDVTGQIMIKADDIKKTGSLKEIIYPRLGITSADWLSYEYQLIWSFKGRQEPIRVPASPTQWIKSSDPAITLIPPLVKQYVELDADRKLFLDNGVASASVSFASMQGGEKKLIRTVILRADDKSSTNKITLYHDPKSPVAYQATWYNSKGEAKSDLSLMTGSYLFFTPPPAEKFVSN